MSAIRLVLFLVFATPAWAGRLEIPLRVPIEAVQKALAQQLAASPAAPNVLYREGPCRFLNLDAPALAGADGQLRLDSPGSAALGVELFGRCQNAADWQGTMHVRLVPQIDADGRLRLHILDSRLSDSRGRKGVPLVWDLAKNQVHPRLQRFSYDIGASRTALLSVLRGAAPAEHAAALELALSQVQVLQPRVEAAQIVVPVAIEIPDAWLAAAPTAAAGSTAAPASAAPLTEAELEALDRTLQPWDAFLVHVIKQVGQDSDNAELRHRLFTLLLDSRYRLAAILSGDEQTTGDPVRALFIDAWGELRSILADARYSLFVDAGDALIALDRSAPGLGATLTAEGLRNLARSLHPGAAGEALAYDWAVDPELGRLFDVQEPPRSEAAPERSWLDFFISSAHAAGQSLDRWVPTRDELSTYEPRIAELLYKAAESELQRTALAAPYDRMYRSMVPTTALIESCWRQYTTRAGKVSYLRSQSGSIGIMQINQVVWRGFYDVQRLRWDTAYNARAGAQILMRYMKDYAIPYAEKNADPAHAPRAAYAVYNAGPRAVGRFLKKPPHPREQRVDEHLWKLYQGVAAGSQADLRSCGVTSVSASQ
ncbi:MAG TPA: lytic transglycosylase domain-containing protein [Burkholderiales bacterium]|nr:lytic transglycosylase domain-containing protein [Burkholderiales bacterium]